MKLYISKATLRTIEKFGNASLTHISATPSDHMSVELDATPLANEASKQACAHRIVDARNEIVKSGYLCVDCGAVFAGIHAPAAPSVEQDQRGAFEAWARRVGSCNADRTDMEPEKGHFVAGWDAALRAARAASTSANVAQLDMSLEARLTDAEADVKRLHAEKMELWNQVHGYSANVAQGSEAVAWFTDDSQSDKSATTWDRNVAERWRTKGWPVSPLYTAPPAQTALTVTPAMVKAAIPWLTGLHHMRNTDAKAHIEEAIKAALTAAQSASGDTK